MLPYQAGAGHARPGGGNPCCPPDCPTQNPTVAGRLMAESGCCWGGEVFLTLPRGSGWCVHPRVCVALKMGVVNGPTISFLRECYTRFRTDTIHAPPVAPRRHLAVPTYALVPCTASYSTWKNASLFVAIPIVFGVGYKVLKNPISLPCPHPGGIAHIRFLPMRLARRRSPAQHAGVSGLCTMTADTDSWVLCSNGS